MLSFLAANPIVLIIAAFVAIGVAYAYQKNEEFRALVDSVWAAIQAAISAAADALEPVFENLVSMVQGFWEILVGIKDFIVGVARAIGVERGKESNRFFLVRGRQLLGWLGLRGSGSSWWCRLGSLRCGGLFRGLA